MNNTDPWLICTIAVMDRGAGINFRLASGMPFRYAGVNRVLLGGIATR
jgi:hypothetical protein